MIKPTGHNMPLNRNKSGRFVLIEVLPLMRLAAKRYGAIEKNLTRVNYIVNFAK